MSRAEAGRLDAADWVFPGVLGCFTLSGFAALLYQTAWLRQFSIVFGTSELAVTTVLAAYMAGLAGGSALAARLVGRIRRPIWVYGLLEAGIGIGALVIPFALILLRSLQVAVLGGRPEPPSSLGLTGSIFYLLSAFLLLALPTGMMGATLPMLTRFAVRRQEEIGSRVGLLYAVNTAGAVAGTLAAAFIFLPVIGLWKTLWVGAAINLVVFGLAAWISRATETGQLLQAERPDQAIGGTAAADEPPSAAVGGLLPPAGVLPLMLVSGAVSFTYEVVWTRLLSHILGGSIFAFATMLASFLTGITIGSALASLGARFRDQSARLLAWVQFGTALLSVAVYYLLDLLPKLAMTRGVGEQSTLLAQVGTAAVVLLPSTLCIGATFPLAVRVLARDEREAARAAARIYAWNTVGAIAGAIAAGFLLLPALKFSGIVWVAVLTNGLLAVTAALLRTARPVRTAVWVGTLAAVLLVLFRPHRPESILRSSPFAALGSEVKDWSAGEVLYYGVGRSATVLLVESSEGSFEIRSNGLPEATIAPRGGWPESIRMLTALPFLARPTAEDVLMVGFGGGVALSGIPPSAERIDVIELEPHVIEANRVIRQLREDDPLSDKRLNIILNDARSSLALTTRRYDVIASQPSHPWTAGASHLYTRQFVQLARRHLKPGGVFVQWMNMDFVDGPLLKTLGATLLEVFRHVKLYEPHPGLLFFLASDEPIDPIGVVAEGRLPEGNRQHYARLGVVTAGDVAAMLRLDEEKLREFCGDAPVNTDDFNRLATRSPGVLREPQRAVRAQREMDKMDPLRRMARFRGEARYHINWTYVVRRLHALGFKNRAGELVKSIAEYIPRLFALAWVSDREQREEYFKQLLGDDPDNNDARYAMLLDWRPQLAAGTPRPDIAEEVKKLRGAEAAVVKGWHLVTEKKWNELKALEAELATAAPDHVCYGEAVRLRAAWRVEVEAPRKQRAEWANQALELLAGAWNVDPDLQISGLSVRFEAARLADRPYVALETARRLALLAKKDTQVRSELRKETYARLMRMLDFVEQLEDDPRLPPRRVRKVADEVDQAIGELVFLGID